MSRRKTKEEVVIQHADDLIVKLDAMIARMEKLLLEDLKEPRKPTDAKA